MKYIGDNLGVSQAVIALKVEILVKATLSTTGAMAMG